MEPMTKYREYAHLLVTVGLNVQRGQDLVIACPGGVRLVCPGCAPRPPTTRAAGRCFWSGGTTP